MLLFVEHRYYPEYDADNDQYGNNAHYSAGFKYAFDSRTAAQYKHSQQWE